MAHRPYKLPVPDQNVLDLRQVMADRAAQAERPQRQWRLKKFPVKYGRRESDRPLFRVSIGWVWNWPRVRREFLKFSVAAIAVSLPLFLVFGIVRLTQAASSVQDQGQVGFKALQDGATALGQFDIPAAQSYFRQASATLNGAYNQLNQATYHNGNLVSWMPVVGGKYKTAQNILEAGQALSRAGNTLSTVLADAPPPAEPVTIQSDGIIQGSVGILGPLLKERESFRSAVNDIISATESITRIRVEDVPTEYREKIRTWHVLTPLLTNSTGRLQDLSELLFSLFAPEQPKEYLVVFQNDDELRATGGFPGTFLLVKFEGSVFKVLDSPGTGPYALANQVKNTQLPPQPLLSVTPHWTFHDANWFLDVPTSADFMLDFYEEARGFRPDGMIFLTPSILENLLKVTGPIKLAGYDAEVTSENFVKTTEQQVEVNFDKAENKPKQFVIDLVPALLQKLSTLPPEDALKATALFLQNADQDNLMIYSQDQTTQKSIERLGWDGRLINNGNDYLAIVDSNLGGNKTDRAIEETAKLELSIEDNKLLHRLTISRTHKGLPGDQFSGLPNKNFTRIYTPANSELIDVKGATIPDDKFFLSPEPGAKISTKLNEAEGRVLLDQTGTIRISKEVNRNVFGAWSNIEVGETQTITFVYTTSLSTENDITTWFLTWQKQPGAVTRQWSVHFDLPPKAKLLSTIPPLQEMKSQTVEFAGDSSFSRAFGVIYK